jgi:hypothetical protein
MSLIISELVFLSAGLIYGDFGLDRSRGTAATGSRDTWVNLLIPKYAFPVRRDVVTCSQHDRAADLSRISLSLSAGMTPEYVHGQL